MIRASKFPLRMNKGALFLASSAAAAERLINPLVKYRSPQQPGNAWEIEQADFLSEFR
jgi:hypothetical protein